MTDVTISGAKGGGSAFKQRADTLRSNDTFEGLLVLCAGPIVGPVNSLKSQKINGTPIEDTSGTPNFKDVVMVMADGDPAKYPQIATLKLGAGASPISVNLGVGNNNPAGTPGPWVVKTMANTGADSIDLRFIASQLYRQDKSGIYEATANLEIQLKPIGTATWINPNIATPIGSYSSFGFNIDGRDGSQLTGYFPENYYEGAGDTWTPETNNGYVEITGKTTSPYVHELRVDVPNTGVYANKGWDIRVRLREVENLEADPVYEKRTIQWESVAAVYAKDVGNHPDWRGVAWAQIFGKASDQFNGAPEIEGDYLTKIVSVPPAGVFNPATRQYTTTTWDGSFAKSYTNDPAWVINDALSDAIFGLSNLSPGAHLNKWDALEVSKYCSQLVPNGDGGTHPRFSLNLRITEPQKADEFIQYLAGAISGFAWDSGDGEWRIRVDKPEIPSDILTLEAIEGEFSYAHSDLDSRFNDITMTFLNEEMDFREDRVRVFDQDHIDTYGRKPTTLVAVGCTSRQEALRRATLRLRSAINEYRMVNYVTNRRGRLLQPFDTILIADGDLGYTLPTPLTTANPVDSSVANNRTTGRVLSMNGPRTTLTLRDSVRLEIGVNYVVHFAVPNPDYNPEPTTQPTAASWDMPTITISRTLTNSAGQRGDVTTLYLDTALPSNIPPLANFALEAAGLPSIPKTYRILEVKPEEDGERVAVTAVEVDTGKYAAADAAVESVFSYDAPDFVVPPPLAPVAGSLISLVEIPGEGADRVNLVVNWQRPSSLHLNGFKVRYRVNNGPLIDAVVGLQDTSWEMVDPAAGLYYFEILSRDRRGAFSVPLSGSLNVTSAMLEALADTTAAVLDLGDDDKLTPIEKQQVIRDWDTLSDQYAALNTRSAALSITTEWNNLQTAYTALDAYLSTLSPPWDDTSTTTDILRTTWRTTWSGWFEKKTLLEQKISEEDAKRATWGNIGGAGKPADNATRNVNRGAWSGASVSYLVGDFVQRDGSSYSAITPHTSTANNGPPGANWALLAAGGDGTPAISAYLTNESVQLWSYANGGVVSYASATGSFRVFSGNTDVSASFSLSTLINPQSLTVGYSGQTYSVTGGFDPNEDTAALTIRATGSGGYAGVTIDKVFSLAKAKGGYEIVTSLPTTNNYPGRTVLLETDGKLYRYVLVNGTLQWTAAVDAADISGQLADAQIAALAASKVTGQLTNAQLAEIAAAKLTGQIVTTQITDNAISSPKISAGAVTAGKIAADAVTANEIAANAVTATEIATGAVVAGKIAAGAVTAGTIAANAVTANEIAANSVVAGKIAANAVTADSIAAGAITAAKMNVTSLSAITATIGTFRTAATGKRMEINDALMQAFDENNMRRGRFGVW